MCIYFIFDIHHSISPYFHTPILSSIISIHLNASWIYVYIYVYICIHTIYYKSQINNNIARCKIIHEYVIHNIYNLTWNLYIRMYTHIYIDIYTYIYIYLSISIYLCMYVCIYLFIYLSIYLSMNIYIYIVLIILYYFMICIKNRTKSIEDNYLEKPEVKAHIDNMTYHEYQTARCISTYIPFLKALDIPDGIYDNL